MGLISSIKSRSFAGDCLGFSLIEALIASAVLSLCAVTLFGALFKSFVLSTQFGLTNDALSALSQAEAELRHLEKEPGLPERFNLSGRVEQNGRFFNYATEYKEDDAERPMTEVLITVSSDSDPGRNFVRRVFLASL